jgi:nitroreductase
MDFYDVIEKRKSIRKFKPELPPPEMIDRILRAAWRAPTWANYQGCRYTVVRDPAKVAAVKKGTAVHKWSQAAPMFIVVSIKPRDSGTGTQGLEYYGVDAGICTEHLVLAVTAEGLGACWIGVFDEKPIREALKIPEKEVIVAVLPMGYPAHDPERTNRKPMERLFFLDEHGKPWPTKN